MKPINLYVERKTPRIMRSLLDDDTDMVNKDFKSEKPKTLRDLRNLIEKTFAEGEYNLNFIDTSLVTNMDGLFEYFATSKNADEIFENLDVSAWDVSNVTNMNSMFHGCKTFNGDLSSWDVSNVVDAGYMFSNCVNFNGDLSSWDVSSLSIARSMFNNCEKFDADLSNWDTRNLTSAHSMFFGCEKFNADISKWNMHNVVNASFMLAYASSFNADVSKWKFGTYLSDISFIFYNATSFNRDLTKWKISKDVSTSNALDNTRVTKMPSWI